MNDFSDRLRDLIKYRNLTQKALASILNITPSTLNGYVAGTRQPDILTIKKIAKALDCNTNYLFNLYNSEMINDNMLKLVEGRSQTDIDRIFGSLGITENIFYAFTNGQIKLSSEMAKQICDIFNVSLDYLLGRTDTKEQSLIVPENLDGVAMAFYNGIKDLSQEDLDAVSEYVEFIKSKKKK